MGAIQRAKVEISQIRSRSKQDHLLWSSCTFKPIHPPSMPTTPLLHLYKCLWYFHVYTSSPVTLWEFLKPVKQWQNETAEKRDEGMGQKEEIRLSSSNILNNNLTV